MLNERLVMQYQPHHLCLTCKFSTKCNRYRDVVTVLRSLETNVFERWQMDLTTTLMIKDCNLYKMDMEVMEDIINGDIYFDDGEGYDDEDGEDGEPDE